MKNTRNPETDAECGAVINLKRDYERNMITSCLELCAGILPDNMQYTFTDTDDAAIRPDSTVISVGISLIYENAHLDRPLSAVSVINLLTSLSRPQSSESKSGVSPSAPVISFDGRVVKLFRDDKEFTVVLTRREAQVFALLYGRAGEIITREEITSAVWSGKTSSNLCDVYISHLRDRLEPVSDCISITYIHTKGYRMDILRSI